MDENRVAIALDIMQLKIINFIKNYKGHDKENFEKELKKLIDEREKVFKLDVNTINKVLNEYSSEFKKEKQ